MTKVFKEGLEGLVLKDLNVSLLIIKLRRSVLTVKSTYPNNVYCRFQLKALVQYDINHNGFAIRVLKKYDCILFESYIFFVLPIKNMYETLL